jgi:glycosyltransferase involved in cell wall biosynthesis
LPRIVVAGARPSPELRGRLERVGIAVVADPPSMAPLLARALAVFVPIRMEGGTRLKILEAMAAARPVVSTGKGIAGLVLAPTYDVLLGDGADAFTSQLVKLVRDPLLRAGIAAHGLETVTRGYDWRAGRELMARLVREPGGRRELPAPSAR